MRRKLLIILLFFFVFSCQQKEQPARRGKAPDFKLDTIDGKTVSLSDYKGKVVLVEFWATWCPPCRMTIPEVEKLREKFKGKDLVVLGISIDQGENVREQVKDFVREFKLTFPVLLGNKKIADLYGVRTIPTLFLLDKNHKVARVYMGYSPDLEEVLEKEIEALL